MKKLLVALLFVLPATAFAECNQNTTDEVAMCLDKEVKQLKTKLNQVYAKAYKQTDAKKELENSQKKWLAYKEAQCGAFTTADAGMGMGAITADLSCQTMLYSQRIDILKAY